MYCDRVRARACVCIHATTSTADSKPGGIIPDDLYVKYTTTYDLKKMDDGEVYIVPDKYTVEFEPKNVKARLDNLFNGNKVLGEWQQGADLLTGGPAGKHLHYTTPNTHQLIC